MKVFLYGRFGQYPIEIERLVKEAGLEIVKEDSLAEVVITFGGDGTILGSERDHPKLPKLPLRESPTCMKCFPQSNEELLKLLVENKLAAKEFSKVELNIKNSTLTVVNDVIVRNAVPNTALRFEVKIGEETIGNLIGDGVVVATPFGSSAYFYSIARKIFDQGIGVAFNNLHNTVLEARVVPEDSLIQVAILRGPAMLALDNNPEIYNLTDGEKVPIRKSRETTKILTPQP